ncbi:MAG TPA: hypothetical protein VGR45_15445, partial [Stellaceae bacterium]|nr:hypothetical protein [Stellaceae bacterium]
MPAGAALRFGGDDRSAASVIVAGPSIPQNGGRVGGACGADYSVEALWRGTLSKLNRTLMFREVEIRNVFRERLKTFHRLLFSVHTNCQKSSFSQNLHFRERYLIPGRAQLCGSAGKGDDRRHRPRKVGGDKDGRLDSSALMDCRQRVANTAADAANFDLGRAPL